MAQATYWVVNLAGGSLSEDKLRHIPYPRLELAAHVTTKTTQAFSMIGGALVGPVVSLTKQDKDLATFTDRCYHFGKTGFLIGLVLGPAFTLSRVVKLETEEVRDRCYRVRFNQNQLRIDRLSFLGAAAGCAWAYHAGSEWGKFALFGYCSGNIAGAAFNALLHFIHTLPDLL